MAKDASPAFLVATIKPSDPATVGSGFPTEGHRITCYNETVDDLLMVAYGIHPKQIVNGPEWLGKDRFDVNGTPDVSGEPSLAQMQGMYRKLLADRFHLVMHRETRAIPIYALTIAKGGPKLKIADPGETLNQGNRGGGGMRILKFTAMPMSTFALNMNFYEDRPVVDHTGLQGRYDFTLKWTFDDSQASDQDSAPSLFTAIREQIGLKMDAVKGPVEVVVIDHVDRPTPN
jgi:uncharacterized protein (TIGR03435 family)